MTAAGPELTAAAYWAGAVRQHGPRPFLRAGGQEASYAGFDAWARVIAARLVARGVRPGPRAAGPDPA